MSKRELPPRSNRGKNTFYTLQNEPNNTKKTKNSQTTPKKAHNRIVKDEVEKKIKFSSQIKRQTYNQNKKHFIFTRGIHYFYDLNDLQRVPETVSYAFFPSKKQRNTSKNNNYTINYSKDHQLIGNTTINQLINRNLIGLPLRKQPEIQEINSFQYNQRTLNEILEMKRNDKNQCHHYLFEIEDKKHNLDRMIMQLEFVNKKADFYLLPENVKKLQQFSMIEKDAELSQALIEDSDLTKQQKKEILQQKIDTLKYKRQALNFNYQNVSETYFLNSLNQKLYNQVKIQKQKLNRFNIYQQMQKSMKQHRLDHVNVENPLALDSFHKFLDESSNSWRSQIDDYFCIDEKDFDDFVMESTFKIISIRLFHEGQNCFYFGKKIFSKLFNKQLELQKQIRSISIEPFKAKIKQIEENLQKFWKKRDKPQTQINILSQQLIKRQRSDRKTTATKKKIKTLRKLNKNEIKVRLNQRIVPIGFYEYYCLKIFTFIYEALTVIQDFLRRTENKRLNVIQHLASLYYSKFQNRLLSVIQNPQFGLLSIALDKLVEIITHKNKQFQTMNYELFTQFNPELNKITTFVKQIQSQSASESSLTFKRDHQFSQILSQSRSNELIDEEIFAHGRKMIK